MRIIAGDKNWHNLAILVQNPYIDSDEWKYRAMYCEIRAITCKDGVENIKRIKKHHKENIIILTKATTANIKKHEM